MKNLFIKSSIGNSEIIIGETLSNASKYLPKNRKIAIITDSRLNSIYGSQFPGADLVIEIPQGENNKTLQTLDVIFRKLINAEFDRSSFILAIGGGIVCDVAGFAAATFMRGIDFGFVSTTLLSQVDASVGGKNGVNYYGYKNMIGTFCLPEFVICDIEMLRTLPEDEMLSGMAEVVKHGAIAGEALFEFIEQNIDMAKTGDRNVLERFVYDSVLIKSDIVNLDAKEKSVRRILNFGHTFGHAIEKNTKMKHGMAISIGMAMSAQISAVRGLINQNSADRLTALLKKLGLPVELPIEPDELFDAVRKDKKREAAEIHFVLLDNIGSAVVERFTFEELESIVYDLY